MNTGCPLADTGYNIVVEAFYNNAVGSRTFGSDLFGDEVFGDINGLGALDWVDITAYNFELEVVRGDAGGALPVPVSEMTGEFVDLFGELFDFPAPPTFYDPEVFTPIRVGVIDQAGAGTYSALWTGRLELIEDDHGERVRIVRMEAYGPATELVVQLPEWTAPAETVTERVARVLGSIGWGGGAALVESPLGLDADTDVSAITARDLINLAAWSSGQQVDTTADGQLRLRDWPLAPQGEPFVATDCLDVGDVAANSIAYVSDTEATLNAVQIIHRTRTGSTSANPPSSGSSGGVQGPPGPQGEDGVDGAAGTPGPGLPRGGAVGQHIAKTGTPDYQTSWVWGTDWHGPWAPGEYPFNALVRDGQWTMICTNPVGTDERPAPQPTGDPVYAYTGADPTNSAATEPALTFVQRYSFGDAGLFVLGYRFYAVPGQLYGVTVFVDPLNTYAPEVLLPDYDPGIEGWVEVLLPTRLIGAQTVMDMALRVTFPVQPAEVTANYDYDTPNNQGTPAPGQILHSNKVSSSLRVHKIDDDGTDRGSALALLPAGATISGPGVTWSIADTFDAGTYFDFTVSPAQQGAPDGVHAFDFAAQIAQPVTALYDADYFDTSPYAGAVEGFIGADYLDAVEQPTSGDAVGIDLYFQAADIADDWQLVALSALTAGSPDARLAAVEARLTALESP